MATTFSSAQVRDRDKILEEKHRKELQIVERKVDKLKRAIDDVDKQKFDLQNRCNQLAQYLGFSDIDEVQRAIDVSDHEVTFRQAFERVQILETEVRTERTHREILETQCHELEEQLAQHRERTAALEKSEKRLQAELRDLKTQYDALEDTRKRAAEYYQRDRRTYFAVHKWLCLEPLDKKGRPGKYSMQNKTTLGRREILREFGPALTKLLGLDLVALEQALKEGHEATCDPADPQEEDPFSTHESEPCQTSFATVVPSSASSHSTPTRQPLSTLLVPNDLVKPEPIETPKSFKSLKLLPSNSSDTEDDSQAPNQIFKMPLPPQDLMNRPAGSSDTEDDSQAPDPLTSSPDHPPLTSPFSAIKPIAKRFMNPNLPSRPPLDPIGRKSNIGDSGLRFCVKAEPEDDADALKGERPAKRPRISLDSSVQTPKPAKRDDSLSRRVFSTGQIAKRKKHYDDENTPIGKAAPVVRTSGQARLEDYTVFKGRGRYSKESNTITKTINSIYTINPEHNGGVTHQYDEVVRGREGRLRMDAGDCEDCRDWYAAIGPMPARDRGPLWRSPSRTPVRPCKQHAAGSTSSSRNHDREVSPSPSDRNQDNIEAHKKQISRHRHNWARAQTPPGYWNIGFPDTQEAREINERAEEMHQHKLREVEKEAERGRWIRR